MATFNKAVSIFQKCTCFSSYIFHVSYWELQRTSKSRFQWSKIVETCKNMKILTLHYHAEYLIVQLLLRSDSRVKAFSFITLCTGQTCLRPKVDSISMLLIFERGAALIYEILVNLCAKRAQISFKLEANSVVFPSFFQVKHLAYATHKPLGIP